MENITTFPGRNARSTSDIFQGLFAPMVFAFLLAFAAPRHGFASTPPATNMHELCEQAAVIAAAQSGVPVSVLKAISLTETGRTRAGVTRPWPWTVNMEGKGVWFDSEDEARTYAETHFDSGARSFDVGCFQINYKWHKQAFSSIREMFDPIKNALYAAKFLNDLFAEKGNWEEAAGAYHSRTPKYANRYKARFSSYRARFAHEDNQPQLSASLPTPTPPIPASRINTFPLLQSGRGGNAMGSLVPLDGPSGAKSLLMGSADNG